MNIYISETHHVNIYISDTHHVYIYISETHHMYIYISETHHMYIYISETHHVNIYISETHHVHIYISETHHVNIYISDTPRVYLHNISDTPRVYLHNISETTTCISPTRKQIHGVRGNQTQVCSCRGGRLTHWASGVLGTFPQSAHMLSRRTPYHQANEVAGSGDFPSVSPYTRLWVRFSISPQSARAPCTYP